MLLTLDLMMQTVCSSEVLVVQPTSTWCIHPKVGSALTTFLLLELDHALVSYLITPLFLLYFSCALQLTLSVMMGSLEAFHPCHSPILSASLPPMFIHFGT
jgi:hypothetical protein